MHLSRIVSGGQTGADRGGLESALHCNIPIGGWIPKGRKAEDSGVPLKYTGLKETPSADYKPRTEANVVDSDATVVFCYGKPTGGSKLTVDLALKHNRPVLAVDLNNPRDAVVKQIVEWLKGIKEPASGVLNVAGSRASKFPGIENAVMVRMVDVINEVNGKLAYPLQ